MYVKYVTAKWQTLGNRMQGEWGDHRTQTSEEPVPNSGPHLPPNPKTLWSFTFVFFCDSDLREEVIQHSLSLFWDLRNTEVPWNFHFYH